MYCSKCKNYLKIGDDTCPECGTHISGHAPAAKTNSQDLFRGLSAEDRELILSCIEGIGRLSKDLGVTDKIPSLRPLAENKAVHLPDTEFLHKMHRYLETCKWFSIMLAILTPYMGLTPFYIISAVVCLLTQGMFSYRSGRRTRSHYHWQSQPEKLKEFQTDFYSNISFLCFCHCVLSVVFCVVFAGINDFSPVLILPILPAALSIVYSIRTWLTARDYFREYNKLISDSAEESENNETSENQE